MANQTPEAEPSVKAMDKFLWQRLVASPAGPKSSTARHVLLTMSLHMQHDGSSCFPSFGTLAKETGLSRRSVYRCIGDAEAEGWLKVKHQKQGGGFCSNQYIPTIPKGVETENPYDRDTESLNRDRESQSRDTESLSVGTESHKVGTQCHPNSNNSKFNNITCRTFLLKDGSEFFIDDEFLALLSDTYPDIDLNNELKQIKTWCYSNASKRKTRKGAGSFVNSWMKRAANGNGNKPPRQQHTEASPKEFDFENQFHQTA